MIFGCVVGAVGVAHAQRVEMSTRLELLDTERALAFTCDQPCDRDDDPDCHFVAEDDLCRDASVEQPHSGWLFGFGVGIHSKGDAFSAGVRLVGTFGLFEPTSGADDETRTGATVEDDEGVTLGHVTLEFPLELRFGRGAQLYVQAVPRVGSLNLLAGKDEEADTLTAGVLAVVGLRFGVSDGYVGASVGRVQHPSFAGLGFDAHYIMGD